MNSSENLEQRLPSDTITFLFTDIEGSIKTSPNPWRQVENFTLSPPREIDFQ